MNDKPTLYGGPPSPFNECLDVDVDPLRASGSSSGSPICGSHNRQRSPEAFATTLFTQFGVDSSESRRLQYDDIDRDGPNDSDTDEEPSYLIPRCYRRRKWVDVETDEEEENDKEGVLVPRHKIRPTSMAQVLGLNMSELELLRFYFQESNPILCAASGAKDSIWMGNVPALSNRSPALKRAAMTFATLHLGKNSQKSTYLLHDGSEHPTSKGLPDMNKVGGYVPLEDRVTERLLIEFTETLKEYKKELMESEMANCEAVLVTSVVIYLVAMSLGPLIPLANFDGGSDLFSIVRNLRMILTIITGQEQQSFPPFQAPDEGCIRLPKEESLWEIVDLVELNTEYTHTEKRRIKGILTKEINSLVQLLNMDITNHSVAHFSAWCTYWQPEFSELKNSANPYALMVICYYAAYTHMWHILFWWADRSSDDVLHIMDHIPGEFHGYLQWPLEIVQTYEYNYEDLLSGKLREMTMV